MRAQKNVYSTSIHSLVWKMMENMASIDIKIRMSRYLELPRARGVGGQRVLDAGHHAPAPHHGAEAEPAVRRPGAPVPGDHGPGVPRVHKPDADLELEPGQGERGGGGRGVGGRGEHDQHVWARARHLQRIGSKCESVEAFKN